MKKTFFMKHTFTATLLVIFGILGFSQYVFSWVAPTGPNVPAPINTSSTTQVKGGVGSTDSNPPTPDAHISLRVLKTDDPKAGLFTEGFLSLGNIPTFGFIGANLAKMAGNSVATRAPISLFAGNAADKAVIVLLNGNGGTTHSSRLGVWSEKDAHWAATRIKTGFFNKLVIGGDPFRVQNYMDGGPQTTTSSYTKRFMGFVGNAGPVQHPSTYDPDYNVNAPPAPTAPVDTCQMTAVYPGVQAGPFGGAHMYCFGGNDKFRFEAVPITNLDIAGSSDFGNGGTCIIRKEDECPLGSYLQKVGSFRNNVCKAFSGSCTAPNNPNPTLDEWTGYGAGYDGADDVAWMQAKLIPGAQAWGDINMVTDCSTPNMDDVATNGVHYFFPNLGKNTSLYFSNNESMVFYVPNTTMLGTTPGGFYRVLYNPNNPKHNSFSANGSGRYILQIGEGGDLIQANAC